MVRVNIYVCMKCGVVQMEEETPKHCKEPMDNIGWAELKEQEDKQLRFELGIRDEYGEPTW